MGIKIFVLDFLADGAFLAKFGAEKIEVEKQDGGKAYKTVGEMMPDLIFVNYNDKPSHCRQTIGAIRGRKKTSKIPIYLVDGDASEIAKITLDASFITSDAIPKTIAEFK